MFIYCIYIYSYAFSRRFYPKRLTVHSSYSFTFYQLLLSLGIEPMILALLAPCSTIWATGKHICTQYLVGAPFALITASIRRGMEVISLWHCWGGMEAQVSLTVAFSSSALLGLVSLIFLLTIPHRSSMGFRSGEFAGQSSTVTPWSLNQLLVPLAVWAGAKSCWKMKSASP